MTLREELDSHRYLFVEGIKEEGRNALQIIISGAVVSTEEETITVNGVEFHGTRRIEPGSQWYELTFELYVAYFVLNESYDTRYTGIQEEKWEGKNFRTTSESMFIKFLETSSICRDWAGDYVHYRICCQNHVINIVTAHEPEMRKFTKS
jgi:hypothetical protein